MELTRFTKSERLFHWSFAIPVMMLAATGVMMIAVSLPEAGESISKASLMSLHIILGFLLVIMPAFVFLRGDRKIILGNVKEVLSVNKTDRNWLKSVLLRMFRINVDLPESGKFNAGQKLNTILTILLIILLSLSGFSMLLIKGSLLSNIVHASLSFVFLCTFAGHLYLALINPSTRHAFRAITTGRVNQNWLGQHHTIMYREIEKFIYGEILLDEVTNKTDLKKLYEKYYSSDISFKDFKRRFRSSELLLAAKKGKNPVAFCRIIGDRITKGYVAEYSADGIFNTHELFIRMMNAAAAKTGHNIYFLPDMKSKLMLSGLSKEPDEDDMHPAGAVSMAGYKTVHPSMKGTAEK